TCVDRYTHRLRDGPGSAAHRFAIARAAPHPGHVTPNLSAYGLVPAHDRCGDCGLPANAVVMLRSIRPRIRSASEGGGGTRVKPTAGGRHAQRTSSHAPPTAGRGRV